MLRFAVSTIITVVAIGALFESWGVDIAGWFDPGHLGAIVLSELSSVLLAIAIAVLVWEACNTAIERQLARFAREGAYARAARLRTLLPMLRTALIVTILTIAGLTALSAVGVNIAPLLAGAGIVGIAVGFGSQKLVQDVVTGRVPAARKRHAGRRLRHRLRPVGDGGEFFGAIDPAPRRRRLGSHHSFQRGDERHQHQSRHRKRRDFGQSPL